MTRGLRWTLIAAWIAAPLALAAWLTRTPPEVLREQLKAWQFWSLECCVALGLALAVLSAPSLTRELRRSDLTRMAALALLALGLTLFVAPRTNRIYYDEQIYQSIGQNFTDLKLAQMCNDGVVEYGRLQCRTGEYNKQPYAYPHLLSLVYRVAGVGATSAFAVNAVAMALSVVALYVTALFLFDDRLAALFAGLIAALTPQWLLWSATAAVEPSAALTCALAVMTTALFCRCRTTVTLAATAVVTAYAVQFRPESFLIVPIVGFLLVARAADELFRSRTWWIGLISFALVAVPVAHLYLVRNDGWGTTEARLSLSYVADNFRVNGRFYLADERFPTAFTLLAGTSLIGRRLAAERFSLLLYFLLFFGVGLLFYAGSYNYGADVRYSLMTYPPLAMLAGLGASRIAGRLERLSLGFPTSVVVTVALFFQFSWYAPIVRATTEEAWAARADVRFAESVAPSLRGDSFVLTQNPGMFHVAGVNAGQMSLVSVNPSYLDYLQVRFPGGVYLHWNFWCNVPVPAQQEFCRQALALKPVVAVHEYAERDQRFVLYRFSPTVRQDVLAGAEARK